MNRPLVPVLYQDDSCIVFQKPANLLTIPNDKDDKQNLDALVNQQYRHPGGLHPAHRLDRDTSGVILFAKGKENQQKLMQAFKEKKVKKWYIAFAHGQVKPAQGKIRIPIKDFFQRRFAKQNPALSALTHYTVKDYYKDFTVVQVEPVTGRTNQIRIHFAKIGHPLVGEDKYAFRKDFSLRFRRTALHALRLAFPHPVTQQVVTVEAAMPDDMKEFLKKHQ